MKPRPGQRNQGCPALDHELSRRNFLAGTAAGLGVGVGSVLRTDAAEKLQKQQKRVLQIFLQGGVSQFESWDPKPGTEFGGPFRAIPTSVPGMQISELLPMTAKLMHHLSLVRSINLRTNDHGKGRLFMEKGRNVGEYPFMGAVASKYLSPENAKLPGYIHISTRGLSGNSAAFLEAKHAQMLLKGVEAPANLARPQQITEETALRRTQLRLRANERFTKRREKALVETYDASYEQAARLMSRQSLFEKEPADKDLERYGKHEFARYCLLARTLLEEGGTCVKVTHHGYDSHAENFNFHIEQLSEMDRPFSMLLSDLEERGMLESTLVMIYSEFGRTPKVNVRYGRDHWGTSCSVAVGGCGIQPGAIIGKTNAKGTAVEDREVDAGHLFHTYFQALGLDTAADHDIPGRTIPIGDPAVEGIKELLA